MSIDFFYPSSFNMPYKTRITCSWQTHAMQMWCKQIRWLLSVINVWPN